ncbi:sigma-54 dependent transcriptional regulator [uncultured Desulfosarcina sp.]|uniref:sigma-54-dependent transcriptional regulator n=1 Tax=uncultured Desulfosarcina sp. TaxID=218289 RepID=UPI0029C95931|nr:sigma-54 dependent transcriptional regulator [uncultured Desulfosarcina sp.]
MNRANRQPHAASLLTIDVDPSILRVMEMRLGSHGYLLLSAPDGRTALELATTADVDLAVIGHKRNDEDGVLLMEKLRRLHPGLPVIILTAYGTIDNAVDAMKRGACHYLTKPFDGGELIRQIEGCLEKRYPVDPVFPSEAGLEQMGAFDQFIAKSSIMKAVLNKVAQIANTDSNVYIEGESGTGKELIARCLHAASPRKDGPFVAINCAAIPENLLESELFGHEKGAFTGADRQRDGLFVRAHGGCFFLDELSELPMSMQVKLLRVLEEREFYPLGSTRNVKVDVRIIAAANRNLEKRMSEGRFREDLFYRIHVIPIWLPPLRKRKADILPLARKFLAEFSKAGGKSVKSISPGAVQKLLAADWPGNVRELKNVMEYAVAMAPGDSVTPDLITGPMPPEADDPPPLRDARDSFEKDYLIELLELNGGNVSQAARMAGKYRADFYVLLRKHGLNPMDFRGRKDSARDYA